MACSHTSIESFAMIWGEVAHARPRQVFETHFPELLASPCGVWFATFLFSFLCSLTVPSVFGGIPQL